MSSGRFDTGALAPVSSFIQCMACFFYVFFNVFRPKRQLDALEHSLFEISLGPWHFSWHGSGRERREWLGGRFVGEGWKECG